MRKKWGMILGLTGMMILGSQGIYAAETADSTAETAEAESTEPADDVEMKETDKDMENTVDIESRIKKGGFSAGGSVHDPSIIKDNGTYYIFGSHMESAKSTDLRNWTSFSSGVNVQNPLFDNLFDGEEEGNPAAFTYVGKNEEGGYSVWAPDVIYNKKMGKYVMYFCTTSSYVKSNICFATADNIEGPYHYEDTFLYSGYSYHDVKDGSLEELMGTDPRPYAAAAYDNNNWPNCIDPDVFYDEDGRMWMVYGSWSGGIFLIEIDEGTGYPIYPGADEENHVDSYYGKKLLGGYHNSIEGPHIMYDKTSGYYYLFLSYGNLQAKGGYQMRLFRCDTVDGTYTDAAGKDMYLFVEHKDHGLKMMGNYTFPSLTQTYMAPGGQTAFEDEDGKLYLVYHQRFAKTGELHEPRVHQLFRTKDGWLVAAPFATSGETLKEDGYVADEIQGVYYLVNHGTDISDKVHKPQKIQLNADGTVTGEELDGTWSAEEGTPYIDVTLGETTYTGVVLEMTDEAGNDTMCFSAKGENNETIWGVKYLLP